MARDDLREVQGGRRSPASLDVAHRHERAVLGGLFFEPDTVEAVRRTVCVDDFDDIRNRTLYEHMLAVIDEGRILTLPELHDRLVRLEREERAGGVLYFSTLPDEASVGSLIEDEARQVKVCSLERRFVRMIDSVRLEAPGLGNAALDMAVELREQIERLGTPNGGLLSMGIPITEIAETERSEEDSPLPDWFGPRPALHVLAGPQSVGKSSLAAWLAQCWAQGIPPWAGAPALPGTDVWFVSAEEDRGTIRDRAKLYARTAADQGAQFETLERMRVFARPGDAAEPPRALARWLRWDLECVSTVRAELRNSTEQGKGVGLLVLDSLARLKPPGTDENSNTEMTEILDPIHALAVDCGVYVLLIHHMGKGEKGTREAARGASAIGDIARATWIMDPPSAQHERELRLVGNVVRERTERFVVAPADDSGHIQFWHPANLVDLPGPGEWLNLRSSYSQNEVAKRIQGVSTKPSGASQRKAKAYLDEWIRRGEVAREGSMYVRIQEPAAPLRPPCAPVAPPEPGRRSAPPAPPCA